MTEMNDDMDKTLNKLSILAPKAADAPAPAGIALARLRQQIVQPARADSRLSLWRLTMKRRTALYLVLFLAVFGLAFSFPAVRAAASDFLGLFRVQKFAAISVSPQQLALLQEISEQGLYPGELEMVEEPGRATRFGSLEEASAAVGRPVRSPEVLGRPTFIRLEDGGSARLTVDVEGARAIMAAAGADPSLLPDSLDGAVVDATIFPAVMQGWDNGVTLVQTASPEIDYPDDVNPVALGEALLQALGMEPRAARELARSIDWSSTLVLPVPQEVATFSEAQIDGVTGLGLSSLDGTHSAVIWQKGGVIYMIEGNRLLNELIAMADSLP